MTRQEAARFLERARQIVQATPKRPDAPLPPAYRAAVEAHFHRLDGEGANITNFPCDLRLIPTRDIRNGASILSARHYFYGLSENLLLIRLLTGYDGSGQLLDVGCGFGRTALALFHLIHPPGSYTGFDINPKIIAFAQKLFEQKERGGLFHFDHFPIANSFYPQENATASAEEFQFPYEASRFDLVVMFSVFTHLCTAAMTNYVLNISRVMRAGGRVLTSAFLLENTPTEQTTEKLWRNNPSRRTPQESPDPRDHGKLKVINPAVPDHMVLYRLQTLTSAFQEAGFSLVGQPHWGSWSGRPDFLSHQDYLVFQKS